MADYTDDDLRMFAEKSLRASPDDVAALAAELVGLRTKVDQLRGERRRCNAIGHPTVTPESLIPCQLDRDHDGDHYSTSGCSGGAASWPRAEAERDAALARVDELRAENAELRENVVHMESERTGKCLACGEDWTCSGYYADIAYDERHGFAAAEARAVRAEQERDELRAAIREQADKWRNYQPGGFYPEASAYANAIENCGDALIDLLDEHLLFAAAVPVVGAEEPTDQAEAQQ